jgi:ribose-phosphate pyrophosphokinase
MFYKRRDTTRIVSGKNPIISHEFLGGDIKGKDILIVDDQLASGQSMLNAARELKARRARRVFVAVTYALLDDQGIANFQTAFKRGIITRVYSTNLSYLHPSLARQAWFVTVDISDFIAYFIDCLNRNESISALLDTSSKIAKYLRRS